MSSNSKARRAWIALSILLGGAVLILLLGLAYAALIEYPIG